MKTTKMSCKELAEALGHHASYVYKMRECGFVMARERGLYLASEEEARAWIEQSGFRVVDGKGEIRNPKAEVPEGQEGKTPHVTTA